MNCQEIADLMDGYLDGELDALTSQKIEQHLRDCPRCEQAYEVETAMAHAISRAAPYYKAPLELRERIQVSLREAVGTPTRRGSAAAGPLPVRRPEGVRRGVFFDMPWNWSAIKANQPWVAIFASTDDPYIPIAEPQFIRDKLGAEYHQFDDQGHFGVPTPMTEFPELLEALKSRL